MDSQKPKHFHADADISKGAVEDDDPAHNDGLSYDAEFNQRSEEPVPDQNFTDFPEPDAHGEHSGQDIRSGPGKKKGPARDEAPGLSDQEPGHSQKQNQNQRKDDPLAS